MRFGVEWKVIDNFLSSWCSMVLGLAVGASSGNLSEMQIVNCYLKPIKSETRGMLPSNHHLFQVLNGFLPLVIWSLWDPCNCRLIHPSFLFITNIWNYFLYWWELNECITLKYSLIILKFFSWIHTWYLLHCQRSTVKEITCLQESVLLLSPLPHPPLGSSLQCKMIKGIAVRGIWQHCISGKSLNLTPTIPMN